MLTDGEISVVPPVTGLEMTELIVLVAAPSLLRDAALLLLFSVDKILIARPSLMTIFFEAMLILW